MIPHSPRLNRSIRPQGRWHSYHLCDAIAFMPSLPCRYWFDGVVELHNHQHLLIIIPWRWILTFPTNHRTHAAAYHSPSSPPFPGFFSWLSWRLAPSSSPFRWSLWLGRGFQNGFFQFSLIPYARFWIYTRRFLAESQRWPPLGTRFLTPESAIPSLPVAGQADVRLSPNKVLAGRKEHKTLSPTLLVDLRTRHQHRHQYLNPKPLTTQISVAPDIYWRVNHQMINTTVTTTLKANKLARLHPGRKSGRSTDHPRTGCDGVVEEAVVKTSRALLVLSVTWWFGLLTWPHWSS
jgi:hypothetical protein